MSEHTHPDEIAAESATERHLPDPAVLADREDIDYCEHTFVHEDGDFCERDYAGRAIVGVTNDAGEVLLQIHQESGAGVLPNVKVASDDDYVAEAVRGVSEQTGIDVEIEGIECCRLAKHDVEGEDTSIDATTHVVLSASPVSDDDPHSDTDGVTAEWRDAVPEANRGLPADDDVRLFVE
ncbi:hypothetical protein C453_09943 [Haloferax elongans ATCC BAA-1513]|uniref:Nudix hydrolase domain-containing protein n=1 Tax=Haloferax elongans ATCC BAA-1513 TaxID=1230453 RepID=M0HNH5_HALEO|nr:hypothetical protein [Haloferax elongans]ELZ86130.1 hypothetical protein C453_09943 [Haloferax elongans ATCC BAA-1513]